MEQATLIAQLSSSNPAEAIEAAKALGRCEPTLDLSNALLDVLHITEHHTVRDAVAIALSDLGEPRSVPVLIALVGDRKTEGHRGTLIYALEGFDVRPVLRELVGLVVTGGFEVRHQAFTAIETIDGEIDPLVWADCANLLRESLPKIDDERRELVEELAEMFEVE